jgi:hypothetical protein
MYQVWRAIFPVGVIRRAKVKTIDTIYLPTMFLTDEVRGQAEDSSSVLATCGFRRLASATTIG